MYNPVEVILKKRNGQILTESEMRFMVSGYISGLVPDYQMSSFLMAIFFRGMELTEIVSLTKIYIESGAQINFPDGLQTVDKHSTGGVGDKITMTLAPIVAACGGYIPMISGRGLGHTGGTLDKLESIPGFDTYMEQSDFVGVVLKHKLAIIAQSSALVPADKKIYALRDVTATVESLPLICASIMSKKIAEGARNLVIDLKVGSGAFMKTMTDAEKLAELLKHTGESFGQKVSVVFTCMDSPLGYAIGNAIEIRESIEYLAGADIPDIDIITKTLAIEMLLLSGLARGESEAMAQINTVIQNGTALSKFAELINLQGGNAEVCIDTSLLPSAQHQIPIMSDKSGFIASIDSQRIGYALIKIGAGRTSLESPLDMGAGAYLYKKIGDSLSLSEQIGTVHTSDLELGKSVVNEIISAISVSGHEVMKTDTIIKVWR
jgi:pyrimidine-nucleoside phosphorylase